MALFKINDKAYNLDYKINKKLKNEIKKDNDLNFDNLKKLVTELTNWHIENSNNASDKLYEGDLLKLVDEDVKTLLDIFDMSSFLLNIKETLNETEYNKFVEDDTFRRNIMYAALLNIIKIGGAYKGSEYGLVFSKAFNYDYATSMMYASYSKSMLNERYIEFLNKYLSLGGSTNVYWLPNYFSDNEKNRYIMEPLYEVIKYTKLFGKINENEKILQK